MAKVPKTYRFDVELVDRVAAYAAARGSTATDVFAAGAVMLLDMAEGGVPDLSAAEPATSKLAPIPTLRRASSVEARRRANPVGMSRQDRINKAGS